MTPDWENEAECRYADVDIFYPSHNDLRGIRAAKEFCHRCPVINDCMELAFKTTDMHAVMGGLSAVERGRVMATVNFDRRRAVQEAKKKVWSYASAT